MGRGSHPEPSQPRLLEGAPLPQGPPHVIRDQPCPSLYSAVLELTACRPGQARFLGIWVKVLPA